MVDNNNFHEVVMSLQECGLTVNDMKQRNLKQINISSYEKLLEFSIETVGIMKDLLGHSDEDSNQKV